FTYGKKATPIRQCRISSSLTEKVSCFQLRNTQVQSEDPWFNKNWHLPKEACRHFGGTVADFDRSRRRLSRRNLCDVLLPIRDRRRRTHLPDPELPLNHCNCGAFG